MTASEEVNDVCIIKLPNCPAGFMAEYIYGKVVGDSPTGIELKDVLRAFEYFDREEVPEFDDKGQIVKRIDPQTKTEIKRYREVRKFRFEPDSYFTDALCRIPSASIGMIRSVEPTDHLYDSYIKGIEQIKAKQEADKKAKEVKEETLKVATEPAKVEAENAAH